MLDLIGKDQRAGVQFVILVARHLQTSVHDADISALHILDHQIQPVQARAKRNRLLINRLQFQRLLEQRIGKIFGHRIFKRLHHAAGERGHATMNIFGRVTTLTGRVVQTFEDAVSKDFPDSLFQQSLKLQSIYQKAVPLRPGLYRLDLVIKDVQSGNIGVVNSRLQVPRYEDDKLDASSLILADQIEHVPAKQIGSGQFVLGSSKVRPRLQGDFTTADKLGIYMQIYNLKPD